MSEHKLQVTIAFWLPNLLAPGVRWSSLDHAAKITARQGADRKARGVKRGLPDLLFWWPERNAGAIELKTAKGRISAEQLEFRDHWIMAGFDYALCRSLDDVRATLIRWNISRETAA